MATATRPKLSIGPKDHGRQMSLDQFISADFQEGRFYELARGKVVVTDLPEIEHCFIANHLYKFFLRYETGHRDDIKFLATKVMSRLWLPGLQCSRQPDLSVYLSPQPRGKKPWDRWIPAIVVEILGKGSHRRDKVEKREEYLLAGVLEYWIIDPKARKMTVLDREGDTWARRKTVTTTDEYRTRLLPGLVVKLGELLDGPPKRKR